MSPQPVVDATDASHEPPTVTPSLLDAVRAIAPSSTRQGSASP